MSAHDRDDFPPHWDPPPRIGYGEHSPDTLDVLEEALAQGASDWVRAIYSAKLQNHLARDYYFLGMWARMEPDDRERYLVLIERLPEGRDIMAHQREYLSGLFDHKVLSEDHRARLAALAGLKPASYEESHVSEPATEE